MHLSHIPISRNRIYYRVAVLASAFLSVHTIGLSQGTHDPGRMVVKVDNVTMRVVGVPRRHEDELGTGWVAAIEARDTSGKVVSRVNAAVTGCEPNKLGEKLGRMFILNGKTNYWSPIGDQVVDLLANAVCAARPKS